MKAQFENKNLPVIGAIAIPSVEINLPIFKGLSNVALLTGAGTMKENQVMGKNNYALASHRTEDGVLQATTRIAVQGTLAATTPIKDANDDMLKAFQLEQKTLADWVA